MKAPFLRCAFLILAFTVSAAAQSRSGGGGSRSSGTTSAPGSSSTGLPAPATFVSGKVVLDEGVPLTEPAAIQTICGGQRLTQTYSDVHGGFSFQMGGTRPSSGAAFSDASSASVGGASGAQSQVDWRGCQLQVVLAGYSSEIVELGSKMSSAESVDLGRVMLRRLGNVEGTSISVTSALAPSAATKALNKGREQEKKGKWDEAQKSLENAVQIYPKYAVAWFELGRVQMHQNDQASAKKSFEQALAADAKYVNPYTGLARLAMNARQWQEVVDLTSKLLVLNPIDFPDAYFLNAVANFYLRNIDAAEKTAREGIKVDAGQQIPRLQYLLGMILLQKHDYPEASEHMQEFLRLAKSPSEVAEAKNELDQIAKLSASVSSPAASEKK
jgi:tetratricopeptide (TPR) repeat protein